MPHFGSTIPLINGEVIIISFDPHMVSQDIYIPTRFTEEYQPDEMLAFFARMVKQCRDSYKLKLTFSPYFALIQSSGCGKSRLLYECARLMPAVPISCLAIQSRFPSQVYLNAIGPFFEACQRDYRSRIVTNREMDSAFVLEKASLFRSNLIRICKWALKCILCGAVGGDYSASSYEFAKSVFFNGQQAMPFDFTTDFSLTEDEKSVVKTHPFFAQRELVIGLDEARVFVDFKSTVDPKSIAIPLRIIRRALLQFNPEDDKLLKPVVVLTGTNSYLANFAPTVRLDNSMTESQSCYLFPPVVRFFEDTLARSYVPYCMSLENEDFAREINNRKLDFYCLGRPLWKTLFEKTDGQLEPALRDVITKLWFEGGNAAIVAVLSARIEFSTNPFSVYAADLVASHMAGLLAVSSDRTSLKFRYLCEPLLSLAASRLSVPEFQLQNSTVKFKSDCFELLEDFFGGISPVSVGALGEIMFQMICMEIIDGLTSNHPELLVPVNIFLQCLVGFEGWQLLLQMHAGNPIFLGKISLLRFLAFSCPFSMDLAKISLIRARIHGSRPQSRLRLCLAGLVC